MTVVATGQPLHIWMLAAIASLVEACFIVLANFAVELNCCQSSHFDLDDVLRTVPVENLLWDLDIGAAIFTAWLWSATFAVEAVYFIGVWVTIDLNVDQVLLGITTGVCSLHRQAVSFRF